MTVPRDAVAARPLTRPACLPAGPCRGGGPMRCGPVATSACSISCTRPVFRDRTGNPGVTLPEGMHGDVDALVASGRTTADARVSSAKLQSPALQPLAQ